MEGIGVATGFIILALYFAIVPTVVGRASCVIIKGRPVSRAESYLWGNIILWAVFQVLCVPMAMLGIGLTFLTIVFAGFIIACAAIVLWKNGRGAISKVMQKGNQFAANIKGLQLGEWIVILLILLQVCVFVFGASYIGEDSATYLATSLDAVERDGLAAFNAYTGDVGDASIKQAWTSWNYYISFLSKISGVHVTAVARTFLPIVLVPLSYSVYWLIAGTLFGNDRKKVSAFLFWMNVIVMLGAYSMYTMTFRLAVCIWEGKAVMAVILLPYLFSYLFRLKKYGIRELAGVLLILAATCAMSLMGVGLTALIIVAFFAADFRRHSRVNASILLLAVVVMIAVGVCFLLQKGYMHLFTPASIVKKFSAAAEMAVTADKNYWGSGRYRWFYYLCLVYLLIRKGKSREEKFLLKYVIVQYAIIWNPIFYYVAKVFLPGYQEFERVYYTLFPELCMACAITLLMAQMCEREARLVCAVACAGGLAVVGDPFYRLGQFSRAENIYKIPQEVVEVCEIINDDSEDGETPKIMACDNTIAVFVRQYSSRIHQLYGRAARTNASSRSTFKYNGQSIFDLINTDAISMEELARLATENDCQYLVWMNDADQIAELEAQGGTVVGETESYAVIKMQEETQ